MSETEIFAIGVNDEYYYVDSYEEAKDFLTRKTGKEVSVDFVLDIFNNDQCYYL